VTVGMLQSSWVARVDNELMVELNDLMDDEFEDLTEQLGGIPYRDTCEDDAEDCFALEDPDYAATLDFENLGDTVLSWSVGGQVDILPELRAALTYIHGAAVDNQGDVTLAFSCPPEADTLGRLGSELFGLCDQTLQAHASLAYTLPSRLHGGLQFDATPTLQLELMGGWVNWSVFDAYEITIYDTESLNELANPDTAELVNQERKWARDNQDSAWGGLDAKWRLHEQWLLGGRALFDRSAVPSWALSPNNYDADTLMLSALAAVSPLPQLQVGLSFTHHVVATRVVDDSQFAMTLAQADRRADAWNYPHSNGTYDGFTERVGIQVRGNFGGGDR
ncbi:MAG: outer membrane protein transport protein, partial [Myxococcota bacterium]|nr:outer membrane protein transport protein [Myxococcota bacterium]